MRIGLIGFGKTGSAVARSILTDPSMSLEWVMRRSELHQFESVAELADTDIRSDVFIIPVSAYPISKVLNLYPVDAIIDFSSAKGIMYYGEEAAALGVRIVSVVSHYPHDIERKIDQLATTTAVLCSPNISIGVNVLTFTAELIRRFSGSADVEVIEEHFRTKNGVSSTAAIIANSLGVCESEVRSVRAGGVISKHEVLFGYPSQTIRIRHEAVTREAFGEGAIFAAAAMKNLPAGRYCMKDLLLPLFEREWP